MKQHRSSSVENTIAAKSITNVRYHQNQTAMVSSGNTNENFERSDGVW